MVNYTTRVKERSRQRQIARKIVHIHVGTQVFLAAQNWICPICNQDLLPGMKMSIDHVYNFANTRRHAGNLLLAHEQCNFEKDNRPPTPDELEMLGLVNRCLKYYKGYYRVVPPPELRGKTQPSRRVFAINAQTPAEFFFGLLTEGWIVLMIRL